jgi:hypothetical protein
MPAWSGLFNGVHNQPHASINQPTNLMQRLARLMKYPGMRATARLATALTGAAPGGTATETNSRIRAEQASSSYNLGGKRVIEPVTIVNRVTTAADEAAIDAALTRAFVPAPYPVDRSRNGGGGKTSGL